LDGTTDFVKTPSDANLSSTLLASNFTIECWIYVISLPDGPTIWTNSVSNSDGFSGSYFQTNGTIGTGKYGVNEFNTTNSIKLNSWNHFALVRNSGTLYVYLNGVQDPTTGAASTYLNTSATKPMQIGSSNQSPPASLNGYISDLRVVASAVYTATFTPPTAPLTAISGTNLLLLTTNGAIYDNAMINDLETVGGAQISTSVYKYGTGSLYFDGNGDNLSSPTTPDLNMGTGNWTIECWVYISSRTLNYPLIFGNNNSGYTAGALAITNSNNDSPSYYDKFFLAFYDVGTFVASGPTNSLNTWYHLAVVRNGTNISMYRDGSSVISTTISSSVNFNWGKLGNRIGGGNWDGAQSYFNGYIDDLRVTKGYARYTTTFTPPTAAFPNTGPY